jgi:hypothetical protein
MTSSHPSDQDASTATLPIELDGRRFPQIWDALAGRPTESPVGTVRRIENRAENEALPGLLTKTIRSQLPWSTLSPGETDRQKIIEAYIGSLERINQCRQDADNLVHAACEANLEFRHAAESPTSDERQSVLKEKLDELLAKAAHHWLPVRNILDAKLVSQPITSLRQQLDATLSQACDDFVKNFFELLARLVDASLFGLAEWQPNHCVDYHFFKQVVIDEETARETHYEGNSIDSANSSIHGRTRSVIDSITGIRQHRLARHEHSVMNAVQTSIGNSRVLMPPEVERLVKSVPDWLYPFVSIIDGDLFRERIIEQDTKREDWQRSVHVRDEPIYGCEPGVIIGPYVLTGWGPREIQREQHRRAVAEQRGGILGFAWLAAGLALLALLLLGRTLSVGGGAIFVVLASCGSIGCTWLATFNAAIAMQRTNPILVARYQTVTAVFVLLFLEWMVARAFTPLSWVTPVVILLAVTTWLMSTQFE